MNDLLIELERRYREEWKGYSPGRCRSFLGAISEPEQARELLVRLLCVDLELSRTQQNGSTNSLNDEDESRASPCVELFKIQFPELKLNPLGLERLIVLEFALAIQHEEQPPEIDSYLAICPSSRLLRNLEEAQARLQEIRYASADDSSSSQVIDKSKSTVPQASKLSTFVAPRVPFTLGRYLLIRYLGRGGMGFVYAALDLSSTAQVAVKMMRRGDGWSVFRFIEEFRWLNQLNHPNLVRLYAAFAEGDARYFSMEYISGKNIRQWYRELKNVNSDHASALKRSLGQLASAIHFLHTQGVIHRDIKCSNVMITPRGRTVLLDLGLAIRQADQNLDELPPAGETMPGTLIYMSPEAYNNQPLTPASDWYSLGVTIYELLAGEVPQANVGRSHTESGNPRILAYDPQHLAQKLTDAPQEIADLCIQLLQLEPEKRPTGEQVLQALDFSIPSSTEANLGCHGRERELAALNRARDRCLTGSPSSQCILLSGETGMGKSTLLKTWLAGCDRSDFYVLAAKNYRQDYTPNRLMNSIVQELVRLCVISPQGIREIIRPHASEIGVAFPQIEQICNASDSPTETSSVNRDTVERSIRQLLEAICSLSCVKPVIIAIDDTQWADASSLRHLGGLLAEHDGFHGLLVIASEVSGIRQIDDAISGRTAVDYLHLEPFSRDVSQLMLEQWSRQSNLVLSQAEAKRLISLSKGSPFLLRELFRSLLDQQIANKDYQSLEVDMNQLVSRRFARMPKQAEVVLQYLAIADQPLLIQQLLATCRLTPRELHASLNTLGHQGWVRVRNESVDTVAELASENFRDAIVDTMPIDRLQRRHYRLARILSSEIDPPWSRIALHYERAAEHRLAAACHIQAAQDAFRIGAYREALYFIEKGTIKEARRSVVEQQQLQLMHADCHAALGGSDIAAQLLIKLAEEETDAARATELRCRAGDQRLRNGNLTEGLQLVLGALSKCSVAIGQPGYLRLRNGFSAWLIASRSMPASLVRESEASPRSASTAPVHSRETSGPEASLYEAMMRLVIPLWLMDHDQAGALIARLALLSESPAYSLALRNQALLVSGLFLSQAAQPNRANAVRRLRLGMRIIQRLRTSEAANCQLIMLIWCMNKARFRIAIRFAKKAKLALEFAPVWDRLLSLWYEIGTLWFSGRMQELIDAARVLRSEAEMLQQPTIEFWSSVFPTVTADLVQDKWDEAEDKIAAAKSLIDLEPMTQLRCHYWFSTVAIQLYKGDYEEASKLILDQWRWFSQSGLLGFGHLALAAFSLRINADFLRLRDQAGSDKIVDKVQTWITQLKQSRFAALRNLADAYQLILDAQLHGCRDFSYWKQVQQQLQYSGLTLYARALQWHESLYADPACSRAESQAAMDLFRERGCVAPERLMNLILPLPARHAQV